MSLNPINIRMSPGDDGAALSVREMMARLLEDWTPPTFEPFSMVGLWNGETAERADLSGESWHKVPLWRGEIDRGGSLTILESPQSQLRQELRGSCDGSDVGIRLSGALRHRPPLRDAEEAWYGRAKLPASSGGADLLLNLIVIAIEWGMTDRYVVISFPLAGYPIATVSPVLLDAEPIRRALRPQVVDENRRALFGWMARLPHALGLRSDAVQWEIDTEGILFDEDERAMRHWECWLRDGNVLPMPP